MITDKASKRKYYPKYCIPFRTHLVGWMNIQYMIVDSAYAIISMWNESPKFLCLNIWSLVGSCISESCGTFKRWSPAGQSGSLEASLNFYDIVPLPVCSLLPNYKHSVTSHFLFLWSCLLCLVRMYSLKVQAKINPFLNASYQAFVTRTRKVTNTAGASRHRCLGLEEWLVWSKYSRHTWWTI